MHKRNLHKDRRDGSGGKNTWLFQRTQVPSPRTDFRLLSSVCNSSSRAIWCSLLASAGTALNSHSDKEYKIIIIKKDLLWPAFLAPVDKLVHFHLAFSTSACTIFQHYVIASQISEHCYSSRNRTTAVSAMVKSSKPCLHDDTMFSVIGMTSPAMCTIQHYAVRTFWYR